MDVDERNIKSLIRDVGTGRLHRRAFIQLMVGAGLTVPMARRLLPPAAVAHAQGHPPADPPARGGHLKMLWWQGPAHLNPHFAVGARDQDGARIFYEPLAAFDRDGELVPILAAEIPTVQNGGVALDSRSVVWRLKKGVSWHDGKPFTAEDVVFNWEYAADPASGATTRTNYSDIDHVDIVDSHTIKVVFKQPKPFWAEPFCGPAGQILPKHVFRNLRGPAARETALAVRPVGTGPYRFVEFKAGTLVRGEINLHYHVASRPVFDTIEMKGGDDAASAARAVIETGEADFAWDAHLDDEVLRHGAGRPGPRRDREIGER
jgi:peptide/nickel transport system substrate-binding protein